jgi:hypothetical protein
MSQSFRTAHRSVSGCLAVAAVLLAGGCQNTGLDATQAGLDSIQTRLNDVERQIVASRQALDQLQDSDTNRTEYIDTRLAGLSEEINALPDKLQLTCPEPAQEAATPDCSEVSQVVVTSDKMLVGAEEYIWIDPPGVSVVARMDTGATSSSVHAENLVHFERDGDDWVRFDMPVGDDKSVTVERPIVRYAKIIQQADPEGSRRPVVAMRVRLGDVQDTFEFTLADRSHLENNLILGLNFLTDISLVDVSRQFIQPRYTPPKSQ